MLTMVGLFFGAACMVLGGYLITPPLGLLVFGTLAVALFADVSRDVLPEPEADKEPT